MNEDRFIRKKQMARMEEPDDLEGMASLEVNRWMFLKKPMAAETGGLGPCLGLLVHDPVKAEAVIGHFDGVESNEDIIREMIDEARQRFEERKRLKVYVRGVSPIDRTMDIEGEAKVNHLEEQKFILKFLEEYGFEEEQLDVEFVRFPDQNTQIKIDMNTGKVEAEIEDDEW